MSQTDGLAEGHRVPKRMKVNHGASVISLSQLSQKLGGRSRSSIYRDMADRRLPQPFRVGGRIYFDEEEVEATLAGRRAQTFEVAK